MRGKIAVGILLALILFSSYAYAKGSCPYTNNRPYCLCPGTRRKEYHNPGETLELQKDPDSCCYIKPKLRLPKITVNTVNTNRIPVLEVPIQTPVRVVEFPIGIDMVERNPISTPYSYLDFILQYLKIKRISINLK